MQRSGILLREVVRRLEEFAPLWLGEPWDNVGLLVETFQSSTQPVKEVLLTNDLTEDVAAEALEKGVQLIISYHPPLFRPVKTITNDQWKTRIVAMCMANNISIYSPHTCYDSLDGGVNDWLAGCFDFSSIRPVIPAKAPAGLVTALNIEKCGAGRFLELKGQISIEKAIEQVKQKLNLAHVHLALGKGHTQASNISTVALCAGSGSSVLAGAKADLLLTGEMSHHEVLDAVHSGKTVILTWHSNSERGFLPTLATKLTSSLFSGNEVGFTVSKIDRDPLFTV